MYLVEKKDKMLKNKQVYLVILKIHNNNYNNKNKEVLYKKIKKNLSLINNRKSLNRLKLRMNKMDYLEG